MPPEAASPKITVVLIEDHAKMRAMVKEVLGEASDFQVIGEAADRLTGFELVHSLRPQVVVIDLSLWNFEGPAATKRLKMLNPAVTIIGMSAGLESVTARKMLEAGVDACLAKEDMLDGLVQTILKARSTSHQMNELFEDAMQNDQRRRPPSSPPEGDE